MATLHTTATDLRAALSAIDGLDVDTTMATLATQQADYYNPVSGGHMYTATVSTTNSDNDDVAITAHWILSADDMAIDDLSNLDWDVRFVGYTVDSI